MTLQPGDIIHNRYRIETLLGQGGFGAVYHAWDESLKRYCAIKENLEITPEAHRQFNREAVVLANLSHPNLPRVTDYFTIEGQGQYLVMDFVEGQDLESLVNRQGPVAPEQALSWISQVADALDYLHSQDPPVLHRDIKPANVRITPQGKAMLVDFGLVKIYNPQLKTTMGARALTPGYAPPEQYGQGSTDPRSDIYALGATLYTLLTGQAPPESVQRAAGLELRPPHTLNTRVSAPVSQAIDKAMSLTPSRRYPTASEFVDSIRPYVGESKPTMVVTQSPRGSVAQSDAASISKPISVGGQSKPLPSKKKRTWVFAAIGVSVCLCLVIAGGYVGMQGVFSQRSAHETSTANALTRLHVEQTEVSFASMATLSARETAKVDSVTQTAASAMDSTATQAAAMTATASAASPTETPTSAATSTSASGAALFGPKSGTLKHDGDAYVESFDAGVSVRDFIAQVRFFNPYARDVNTWDYGLFFRYVEDGGHFRLVIRSSRRWFFLYNPGSGTSDEIREGVLTNLNIDAGGYNDIKLACLGDKCEFYLNGSLIATLDVSRHTDAGDISVGTGFYTDNEVTGEETRFEDFTIWNNP